MKSRRTTQFLTLTAVAMVLGLFGLGVGASAQDGTAQISVRTPTEAEIKEGGEEFRVEVLTSDVTNLAAFQFNLKYDRSVLEYRGVKEEAFLGSTGRPVMCSDPLDEHQGDVGIVHFACATTDAPVSLGGKAGPNGSGTLAEVVFLPVGGGTSPLDLADAILVAAEIDAKGDPVQIQSAAQGGSLEVIGTGGGISWLLIGSVAGAIVVVVGGGAGLLLSRRLRSSGG
jgi:Cohesin domain